MPDPSAVWTRGDDRHSEWGGRPLTVEEIRPHYLNDYVLARALAQAARTGWVVRTNPFEGGSDHTPFLSAGKPGLLLWHFTDVFYHTDNDRLDKVSPRTLENVAATALTAALGLATADGATARQVVAELERAALARLATEEALSRAAVAAGGDRAEELRLLRRGRSTTATPSAPRPTSRWAAARRRRRRRSRPRCVASIHAARPRRGC
jgi:hypothetical protein